MNDTLKKLLKPIASLKLTVALLAMSIVLIFAATWEQIDYGIWTIVEKYFRSFFVWIRFQIFLPRAKDVPGGFPWPGGYLIGPLLLVNLLAAHAVRFKMKAVGSRRLWGGVGIVASVAIIAWFHQSGYPEAIFGYRGNLALILIAAAAYAPLIIFTYVLFEKRTGIILIHTALILLLVGELIRGQMATESRMPIYEGQTIRYSHNIQECELAITEPLDNQRDRVVAIAQPALENAAGPIHVEALPFDIRVDSFMDNSQLRRLTQGEVSQATAGFGRLYKIEPLSEVSGVAAQQTADMPSAVITLLRAGQPIGTYLVSLWMSDAQFRPLGQTVRVDGRTFELYLRWRRYYKPYSMKLIDFNHDTYTGTSIPKNFSSQIHLVDPSRHQDRDVLISMNRPLRYHGETFFQASWLPGDAGTVLQVVDNPGRHLPYIACALGGIGLIIHFGFHLSKFLKSKQT